MTTTVAGPPMPQGSPAHTPRHSAVRETLPVPSRTVRPLAAVVDRLTRSNGGVSVVVGPGGYGKTSQVALWARGDRRAVAWIDLEPRHDDAEQLLEAIVEALAVGADAHLERPEKGRRTPHQFTTLVAPELGRALGRSTTPFVLVFDDVHHLRSQPSIDMLDALVRNVPAPSTIVLIGRSAPPLGLAGLRAQGAPST